MWQTGETSVFPATGADLRVIDGTWDFAERHRDEIGAHWKKRVSERPRFFNGTIHVLSAYELSPDGRLSARFLRTDFASFLYWRETGWRDPSVMDCFGTALVLSADGRLLLGQQRSGNLNDAAIYPPSGFIDPADIGADRAIDIDASVMREVHEETGLDGRDLAPTGTYVVCKVGPVLSIGVPLRASLGSAALDERIARHIAADPESELVRTRFAEIGDTLDREAMPDYARALLRALPGLKTSL
jgi:8-oxo-dGTP pyrophosphatase MutT (NUDIX family)